RLIAYLFIVLGLGLTFNVNASAESGYCIDGLTSSFYRDNDGKKYFLSGTYWVKKIKNRKNHRDCHKEEFISKAKYEVQYKKIKKLVGPFKKKKSIPLNSILTSIKGTHVLDEYNRIYESINNTQITKAEPSQTQKVASKKTQVYIYRASVRAGDHWDTFLGVSDESKEQAIKNAMNNCKKSNYTKGKNCKLVDIKKDFIRTDPLNDTQIAKAEPTLKPKTKKETSQTQKVAKKKGLDHYICIKEKDSEYYLSHRVSMKDQQSFNITYDCYNSISEINDKKIYDKMIGFMKRKSENGSIPMDSRISKKLYESFLPNKQTQIAKVEPSQTQKVARSLKYTFCQHNEISYATTISILPKCVPNYNKVNVKNYIEGSFSFPDYRMKTQGYKTRQQAFNLELDKMLNEFRIYDLDTSLILDTINNNSKLAKWYSSSNIQIAKAEPSQTQKVAKAINTKANTHEGIICVIKGQVILPNGKLKYDAGYASLNIYENKNKSCANINNSENISYKEYLKVLKNPDLFLTQYGDLQNKIKNKICINNETLEINNSNKNCVSDESELLVAGGSKDVVFLSTVEKKIALKPKKKIKVAKKEPKQEEFQPKKTNQDNEAPVITIAEAITVNDTSYILEGRVTDKANKIFVEIDGQPVQVKKGKFKVKRYSPVDEQIKIVAIDQWGNKSKTKLVNITIDIDETIVANKLEPLNPSNISNKSSNNKVALIIGIENYTEAPKANYANLDAKYFFDYARRAFGVKKQNINLLVNEEATVVKTDKAVSLWLKSKIKKNKSDLIIFFAGHGLASSDGKELYLLPQDGNPDRLERTALSRTDLFKEIISLNPKSVTMFLDTCYSGVSRDEQMLLASARPIRIVADEQDTPNNFTIFSASQLDQISSGLKEANHGIFSYYLMKGLEGKADTNQDKQITNGELLAYMDENVSQKASELGREQNPSLAGDPDKVLMSYR
ncbi:caspase family protein, partial [Candidatus Pelagibacter sp.]|nr:caspase family protein [Candidatus Pelagibacter sp.]